VFTDIIRNKRLQKHDDQVYFNEIYIYIDVDLEIYVAWGFVKLPRIIYIDVDLEIYVVWGFV
jgi:hypothetical protein